MRPVPIRQPSPEEIRRAIADVRSLEPRGARIEEMKDALVPLYTGWMVTAPVFDSGIKLFRGRELQSPPARLSELAYPPASVAPANRASRQGEPLLYASTAREAVFFELGVSVGKRLAIVHYETTAPLTVMSIGYTEAVAEARRSNRPVPPYGRLNEASWRETDRLVNDFLSEMFTSDQPEKHYVTTIAVAEKLLNAEAAGGLLYPTIAMNANADNVALKPAYVDNYLTPTYAEFIQVTAVDGMKVSFDTLDEARRLADDGTALWLGHMGTWQVTRSNEELRFEAVDGHWVARDTEGVIVDPS
jgi:hypothetical protein